MTQNVAWSEEVWSPDYDPTQLAPVYDYPDTGLTSLAGVYPAEPDIEHRRGPGPLMRLCRWGFGNAHGYTPYGGGA
jgi:hypothetical protein